MHFFPPEKYFLSISVFAELLILNEGDILGDGRRD